ncbi:MAG TPA: PadR family transcriptional regulator [Candidatus Paceibacterota bacterium]|nr:PadR family transcriptional regulator [Candidatus Paceibacterota bacterium]
MKQKTPANDLLTPAVFYILLALSAQERHGYDIMKQVKTDSAGAVAMGPGTLYGSLKRMMNDELVEEVASKTGERRIYYRLTIKGKKALGGELRRFAGAVKFAKEKGLKQLLALRWTLDTS